MESDTSNRDEIISVLVGNEMSAEDFDDEGEEEYTYQPTGESWLLCMPQGTWAAVSRGKVSDYPTLTLG